MRKRVLMLAPSYYPQVGGVENHLKHTIRELKRMGDEALVLVRYSAALPSSQTVEGVPVLRLPEHLSYISLGLWFVRHVFFFRGITTVHSHDFYIPALRRLYPNIPWVHTFHGYEGYPVSPAAINGRRRIRDQVGFCVGVGQFIEKWYGTKLDYVTYGAVESITPKKQPKRYDIIFYGRLEPDTGFKEYLEGFSLITKANPNTSLLVLGDGSEREWAEDLIAKKGLNVTFKGRVNNVLDYLPQAKVGFVSGYLAILEAAIHELPIIAFYGTPIKKDYLECHPQAKNMHIVDSPRAIAAAYTKAQGLTPTNSLTEIRDWARMQTWEKLAIVYSKHY